MGGGSGGVEGVIDHLHCENTIFKMALHSVNGEAAAIKHTVN